jgi:hypothetical protein
MVNPLTPGPKRSLCPINAIFAVVREASTVLKCIRLKFSSIVVLKSKVHRTEEIRRLVFELFRNIELSQPFSLEGVINIPIDYPQQGRIQKFENGGPDA